MTAAATRSNRHDVIVIGAGHNGLTAAALLARRGREVLVLERRPIVGGIAAGEVFEAGYRTAGLLHDTSGIRPEVVDDLELKAYGLTFTADRPPVFAPQKDGHGLLLHHDPEAAAGELGHFSSRDAERYVGYREFLARIHRFTKRWYTALPPDLTATRRAQALELLSSTTALRRLGRQDMLELLRIVPMCLADWLGEWFETDLLKCLLAAPALDGTFMGPWSPGSSISLIRLEAGAGGVAPGGPSALVTALEAAARAQGVVIRTEAEVREIRVSDGSVAGVTLVDGEQVDAPIVAAACDPKRTFLRLVPGRATPPKLEQRLSTYRARGTTAKVNLALSAPFRFACRPELEIEHARVGERLEDLERAFDAVKYGRFSAAPMLDIFVPSVRNPDLAAAGHSVVSILAHFAPYGLSGGWDARKREELGDVVLATLAEYAPVARDSLVAREVLTPADLEDRYGLTGGHIHHGEHALDQLLIRPCPECSRHATPIRGLYLCGSGTHPGGGVTCAPGALAAKAIQ